MRLMLYPTDAAFAQNIAELSAAVKEKRPYAPHHFEVHLGDQRLETPSVRLYGEFIYLLGADLIREARLEIKDVSVIVAHFRPRAVLAILGPSLQTNKPSVVTLTSHPDRSHAELAAMFHFEELGVKAADFHELLLGIRNSLDRVMTYCPFLFSGSQIHEHRF